MSEENRLESLDAAAEEAEVGEEMTEIGPEAEPAIAETEPPLEDDVEAAVPEAVSQPDARPEEPASSAMVVPKAPKPVTRARVFWTSFGLGLLFFVLAVVVSLGILVAFNGGLWYASPNQVVTISRQVDGLTTQTGAQAQDLAGLRARLDNLEAFSGRIEGMEAIASGLQADVAELQTRLQELGELEGRVDAVQAATDQLQTDADQLQSEVQALGAEVETLHEQGGRLQGFLEGLRDLLDDLLSKEEGL